MNHKTINSGEDAGKKYCWWECKLIHPLWKTVWRFLTYMETVLSFDSAILLLDIYPSKIKSAHERIICIPMLIAVQFIIAKIWNQPRYPPIDNWTVKFSHVCTMECYSTIKIMKSCVQQHCMQLESIMLNEWRHSPKDGILYFFLPSVVTNTPSTKNVSISVRWTLGFDYCLQPMSILLRKSTFFNVYVLQSFLSRLLAYYELK